MASELPPDPNLDQVERDLSAYAPRPPRIDRDRLMFEAGRAAAATMTPVAGAAFVLPSVAALPQSPLRSPYWLWPTSTLVMTVVAAGLGLVLSVRSVPLERVHVVERFVPAPSSAPHPAPSHPAPSSTIAVSGDGLHRRELNHQAEEGAVLTIESLPENHLLRVRHVALTQGVDALAPVVSSESPRTVPPPTRGALMRAMAIPLPDGSASRPAMFQWRHWFTSELPK